MEDGKRIEIIKEKYLPLFNKNSVIEIFHAYIFFILFVILIYQGYIYFTENLFEYKYLIFTTLPMLPLIVSALVKDRIKNILYPPSTPLIDMLKDDYDISKTNYYKILLLVYIYKAMYLLKVMIVILAIIFFGVYAYESADTIITVKSLLVFCSAMLVLIYLKISRE